MAGGKRTLVASVGADEGSHHATDDGAPVWPVRDDEELDALRRLAKRFGASVETSEEGRPAEPTPDPARGEVALLDGGLAEAAADLFARLTRRTLSRRSATSPAPSPRPAVVITGLGPPHPDVLEDLYDPALEGPAPGLIWGRSEAELFRNVKLAAAAAFFEHPGTTDAVFVNPAAPIGIEQRGPRVSVGGETPREDIRRLMSGGLGALAIVTHSDGIDAGLAPKLLLCSLDHVRADADENRAPRCHTTGVCHRLRRPVADVVGSPDVMHPETIAAPILVWGACFGVMAPAGAMDPAWGLADRFLAHPEIGVVVTGWEVSYVLPPLVTGMLEALGAGSTVGEAVAWLNRSGPAVARRFRLCILGDPSVRLQPGHRKVDAQPLRPRPSQPVRSVVRDDLDQLAYLRVLLGVTKPDDKRGEGAVTAWTRATEAVRAAEIAWIQGRFADVGAELRSAVLEYVTSVGPLLYHGWMSSADVEFVDSQPCRTCGHPHHRTTRYRARFAGDAAAPRQLLFCPGCSFTQDAPEDSDLIFGWRDGAFVLQGERPPENWRAALVVVEHGAYDKHIMDWPADVDGRPAARLTPDAPLPPGPLDAVYVQMHGTRLTIKAQKMIAGS